MSSWISLEVSGLLVNTMLIVELELAIYNTNSFPFGSSNAGKLAKNFLISSNADYTLCSNLCIFEDFLIA